MNATVQAPAEKEPKQSKIDPPLQANSGQQGTAGTPPSGDAPSGPTNTYPRLLLRLFGGFQRESDSKNTVRDRRFIRDIRKLRLMRSIQRDEGVVQPQDIISDFWPLLQLRYARSGRLPTASELENVDKVFIALSSKMKDDVKRKWASSQVPMLIAWLPLLMLIVAGITLGLSVYAAAGAKSDTDGNFLETLYAVVPWYPSARDYDQFVVAYLIWSVCMGVIGAAASVGMNAISVLNDATFDISNRHQLTLRVVLGGVFALVLVLPFGLASFASFCYYAGHLLPDGASKAGSENAILAYSASNTSSLTYAFALLAPFLLGYSTSLLTNVLSQLMNGAQQWLAPKDQPGKSTQTGQPGAASAPAR